VLEPAQADLIRARKLTAISQVAPDVVASANPGCSMHLAAAGVVTAHPMTLSIKPSSRPLQSRHRKR